MLNIFSINIVKNHNKFKITLMIQFKKNKSTIFYIYINEICNSIIF